METYFSKLYDKKTNKLKKPPTKKPTVLVSTMLADILKTVYFLSSLKATSYTTHCLAAGLDQVRELQPKNVPAPSSYSREQWCFTSPAQLYLHETCKELPNHLPCTPAPGLVELEYSAE